LKKRYNDEISRLLGDNTIERAKGPTKWINCLVPVEKGSTALRLCLDGRNCNTAIERERQITPTIEDVIQAAGSAKYKSHLDFNQAYHQVLLHEESRRITTFIVDGGIYWFRKLVFGISSASEIFQDVIRQILVGIPNQINIADDILVYGHTIEEHDEALDRVMKKLHESGATLNEAKCKFGVTELVFFGLRFGEDGVSLDEEKTKALREARAPKTTTEVTSFLGFATYCARFIPDFAALAKPLRALTKEGARFEWNEEHQQAFESIRTATLARSIGRFNESWTTELIVDASPEALSALLTQFNPAKPEEKHIVNISSRSLSVTETRYSHTEKEGLACVWGCERNELYLIGHRFTLFTDNRAIELILRNARSKPPARILRWSLRLQHFDFEVRHRDGRYDPADFFSRQDKYRRVCPTTTSTV
jgi:hypothetical protein